MLAGVLVAIVVGAMILGWGQTLDRCTTGSNETYGCLGLAVVAVVAGPVLAVIAVTIVVAMVARGGVRHALLCALASIVGAYGVCTLLAQVMPTLSFVLGAVIVGLISFGWVLGVPGKR